MGAQTMVRNVPMCAYVPVYMCVHVCLCACACYSLLSYPSLPSLSHAYHPKVPSLPTTSQPEDWRPVRRESRALPDGGSTAAWPTLPSIRAITRLLFHPAFFSSFPFFFL